MNAVRRKWARPWLLVLAVLAVAGMGGCGGGDDDDGDGDGGGGVYDFNGTWTMNSKVVQSNVPEMPVGDESTDVVRITQVGTKITVAIEDVVSMTGSCDPVAGTFTVNGKDGTTAIQMNGVRIDADTFGGGIVVAEGPVQVSMSYTAQLVSRTLAISQPVSGDGLARALPLMK